MQALLRRIWRRLAEWDPDTGQDRDDEDGLTGVPAVPRRGPGGRSSAVALEEPRQVSTVSATGRLKR